MSVRLWDEQLLSSKYIHHVEHKLGSETATLSPQETEGRCRNCLSDSFTNYLRQDSIKFCHLTLSLCRSYSLLSGTILGCFSNSLRYFESSKVLQHLSVLVMFMSQQRESETIHHLPNYSSPCLSRITLEVSGIYECVWRKTPGLNSLFLSFGLVTEYPSLEVISS